MAIVTIPKSPEKWLILFIIGVTDPKDWYFKPDGAETTYNDSIWSVEQYSTEQAWVDRLAEFGIDPFAPPVDE